VRQACVSQTIGAASYDDCGAADTGSGAHGSFVRALRRPVCQSVEGCAIAASRDPDTPKALIAVLTDIANVPDDRMSMVRLLVCSNQFER
jgi:hypothetical protein